MVFIVVFIALAAIIVVMAWRYDHSSRARPSDGNHSAWSAHDSLGGRESDH
jgi:hypothetical protein